MAKLMRELGSAEGVPNDVQPTPGKRSLTASIPRAHTPVEPRPPEAAPRPALPGHPDPFDFTFPPLATPAPLPATSRGQLEEAFGMDLGDVRIFADSAEADALGAEAFARGGDIHFARGRDARDLRLLAHEVAHVAQQAEGRVGVTAQAYGGAVNEAPHLEAEADGMADEVVAGRPARRGPRLQPARSSVAQGYFTHGGRRMKADSREVLAVRIALLQRGTPKADMDEFDRARRSDDDEGTLANQAPSSVARAVRDLGIGEAKRRRVAPPSSSSSSGSERDSDSDSERDSDGYENESSSDSDSDTGDSDTGDSDENPRATLGDYDSDHIPDGSDGEEITLRTIKDRAGTSIKSASPRSIGFQQAKILREFRATSGRMRRDPERYPPRAMRMGSSRMLMTPNPIRKDCELTPLKKTPSEKWMRDGKAKKNVQLAPLLDADRRRLRLSYEQMNDCLRQIQQLADSTVGDMPHTIDRACLHHMRELVAIWVLDEARASRAIELIEAKALANRSFARRIGEHPSYGGAPDGGVKHLRSYTAGRKAGTEALAEKDSTEEEESSSSSEDADDEEEDEEHEDENDDGSVDSSG